jgi:serine/threonine-protein kinase
VEPSYESWELAEGDEIVRGRYAVDLLGGGRRYEAYLAWDDELHALVVAKLLRPDLVEDGRALHGLAREASALDALAHPSLVRGFGAVVGGERPHVLLEYLDGPRLSTLIRRYGVILEQLLPLALELTAALHYMAARGFVHLDVKPKNVVMSAPPRLIDLSVAQRSEDLATLDGPVGTDPYMAPEQADPARFGELGPPADVWGLGVTLFEAITGELPFERPGEESLPPAERFPQISVAPAPLPRDLPPAVADLVLAALEKSPANRPVAGEVAAALEPLVAALPAPRLGLFRPGGRTRQTEFLPG